MTRIHSTRDALLAQVFEDLDGMLDKMQEVQKTVLGSDRQLKATTAVLDDAADRFRMAVTLFTEQAKTELSEHMERTAERMLAQKTDEIQLAMQKAARNAFEAQSWDTAGALADRLKDAAGEFSHGIWARLIENGVVALLAGIMASALTYGLTAR